MKRNRAMFSEKERRENSAILYLVGIWKGDAALGKGFIECRFSQLRRRH